MTSWIDLRKLLFFLAISRKDFAYNNDNEVYVLNTSEA